MDKQKNSFFSVPFELVGADMILVHDLYVNSSVHNSHEHFVRISLKGDYLSKEDLQHHKKYLQLYVHEAQRGDYLRCLVKSDNVTELRKVEVIKDAAIAHLNILFDGTQKFTSEVLQKAVDGCRESVDCMVDMIQDKDIDQLQEMIGQLSFHDFYTYDHSINVSMYSITFLKAIRPSSTKEEVVQAGLGGLLHDLGKINIPTSIINNPGKLSDEDFAIIKTHPDLGKALFDSHCPTCQGVDLGVVTRVIYEHHENFNGTGYPQKLAGEDIHIFARITAIADFFDAITTKRSYHNILSVDEAVAVMEKTVGKKLDPILFDLFKKNIGNLKKLMTKKDLPIDFDPCQPHNFLFSEKENADHLLDKNKKFGSVRSADDMFGKKKK
jgi:HD-GYP domain-containing protein (c-di-GMP phosphodiesterase class II)